jgi:hypothetical protein
VEKREKYLVIHSSSGWQVKREGYEGAVSTFTEREEAWADGKRRARGDGGEAVLHESNGTILTRNSYAT